MQQFTRNKFQKRRCIQLPFSSMKYLNFVKKQYSSIYFYIHCIMFLYLANHTAWWSISWCYWLTLLGQLSLILPKHNCIPTSVVGYPRSCWNKMKVCRYSTMTNFRPFSSLQQTVCGGCLFIWLHLVSRCFVLFQIGFSCLTIPLINGLRTGSRVLLKTLIFLS